MIITTAVIPSTILSCIFFVLGLLCGRFSKLYKFPMRMVDHKQTNQDNKAKNLQKEDLEMTENVAYGPL